MISHDVILFQSNNSKKFKEQIFTFEIILSTVDLYHKWI